MKASLYSVKGEKVGTINIPPQFSEDIRNDLIKRSILSIESRLRQPYGTSPEAGKKTSAKDVNRRGIYGSWANKAMASIARIRVGSGSMSGTARQSPQAVKGRRAHPPMVEKIWDRKINSKENKQAIRSAIAATAKKDIILKRGHKLGKLSEFPLVVEDGFEAISKTKDVLSALEALGFENDILRASEKKVRAGIGKMRGRKYKKKKSVLIVVNDDKIIKKSAENISGIDVCNVRNINAKLLAPGTHAGRLTLWTKGAMETLDKEKLFY